ncbi:5484_t:CDS:2, partial [Cetraspora pellucida]
MTLKTFFNSFSFSRGAYSLIDPNQKILRYSRPFLTFHYIRLKLCYFFLLAAYCSFTFFSLFLSTVFLLPKSLIGVLLSVSPFVGLVSSPCWSILADQRNLHRTIMILCTTCIIFAFWSIPFTGKYFGFGGLIINLFIYSIFDGGIATLVDNLTMNVLNREGDFAEYGRQRLFGTISCGISIAMLGFLIDRLNSLYVMFFTFGFFMGLFLLVIYLTPLGDFRIDHHDELIVDDIEVLSLDQFENTENKTPTQVADTIIMETAPTPFIKAFSQLITKPRLLLFLFILLSTHTVKAATSSFLYIFLSEDLKADASLLGLSSFVGVTLEIVVFYFGKHVLEFTFPEVIVVAAGITTTLRVALYACFGIEFALVKPASLEIISQVSPPRLRATALGILAATESLSS